MPKFTILPLFSNTPKFNSLYLCCIFSIFVSSDFLQAQYSSIQFYSYLMASFSGNLHRPLSAMAAVVVAAMSTEIPDRFHNPKPAKAESSEESISRISISNLSLIKNINHQIPNHQKPDSSFPTFTSSDALLSLYHYAKLANPLKNHEVKPTMQTSSASDVLYRWHLPYPNADSRSGPCASAKSQTVVVLLGWLGAKQKHLKRYAEWYTSRGFHVVTFTFPMADVVSYKVGGKMEESVELLADHLAGWVEEESGKKLVFHTFSNTGWLTYGALLERFQNQDPSVMGKIKGCIVDSAPVAASDPQVWASGFSAAFLKKQSVAIKGSSNSAGMSTSVVSKSSEELKPAVAEAALLAILEKFFGVVLNLPSINRRLHDVLTLLSSEQPKCPQLYIYSSADRVIPSKSVESFIERQRIAGHEVRACDFLNTPHVDHFRNHPSLYTSELTNFLEDCVLTCCKDS